MNYIEAQRKVQERAKAYTHQNFAGALKGKSSGSAILLDDVSPIEHEMGVKVRSKNLIPYPFNPYAWESGGITFTDNGDGSVTINGTATSAAYCTLARGAKAIYLHEGETITFSGSPLGSSTRTYWWRIENKDFSIYVSDTGGRTYTVTQSGYYTVQICVASGVTVDNVTFYPQLEKGTTATPFTPYVSDLSAVSLKKQGAQLIPYPYAKADGEHTSGGMTIAINGEGDILVSGTPTEVAQVTLYEGEPLVKSGTCVLSDGKGAINAAIYLELYTADGTYITALSTASGDCIYNAEDYPTVGYWYIRVKRRANNVEASGTLKPMFNVGTTAMPFTPYIEPTTYSVSADGTVEGVKPIYPNTTLTTDTSDAVIECEYNRDLNKAFEELTQAIISLGGNI